MLRWYGFAALALLAGCKATISPEEQRRRDDAAVAAVKAIQDTPPPLKLITLQPLGREEIVALGLDRAGCVFAAASAPTEPLVVALPGRAVVKFDAKNQVLASDFGGAKLENGAWERYTGNRYTLSIKHQPGVGALTATSRTRFSGELTLRDAWDRAVYTVQGPLDCGS